MSDIFLSPPRSCLHNGRKYRSPEEQVRFLFSGAPFYKRILTNVQMSSQVRKKHFSWEFFCVCETVDKKFFKQKLKLIFLSSNFFSHKIHFFISCFHFYKHEKKRVSFILLDYKQKHFSSKFFHSTRQVKKKSHYIFFSTHGKKSWNLENGAPE